MKMTLPLTGIVPPLVTPLRDRDELDVPGLEKLVEHVLSGGVAGLFILGTTGEGPSLSYRLRGELVARVCRQVSGRVPVLVGITDTAFAESVNLARTAEKCGADAVVVATPYYNMPPLTKVPYEIETVRHALDHPKIIGFKDSSGDLNYFGNIAALLKSRPDWSLLIGPEEKLLDALRLGGHGGVSGGANLFPKLYVQLVAAHRTFGTGVLYAAVIVAIVAFTTKLY